MIRRFILAAALSFSAVPALAGAAEVNVYTYREPALIQPLFDAFTKETGITVNAIFAKDGLEQRIAAEGDNSPADVLITTDIARLKEAVDLGVAAQVKFKAVPETYRDPGGYWTGLSLRARVVYASTERVKDEAITYEDLADPKWKGKICIRSGQHIYNNALFAAYLAKHGEEETLAWLTGLRNNLAKKPSGADRDVVKDIAAGVCDIGIGNTYYVGLMLHGDDEQKAWASSIKVLMPTFKDGGTHVNLSGAVIARHAPDMDNAVKLVQWLTSDEAQKLYASTNFEYPVRPGIEIGETVAGFGALNPDPMPLANIAKFKAKAAELVDRVAFDEGPAN